MINAELSISYILMLIFLQHYVCASVNPCSIVTLLIKEPEDIKGRVLKYSHNKIIANIFL